MVFVIFSFAHEDTKRIEKMQLESGSPATTSLDKSENAEPAIQSAEAKETKPDIQLR